MTSTIRNLIIVVGVAIATTACAYAAFMRAGPISASVFEIRAIDQQGHPVAGAEVWLETQQVGVTDSFGIWRRNLKLPEGSEAKFNFRKKLIGKNVDGTVREYSAVKSFQVGKSGQVRAENHRGSVKLVPVRL